MLLNIALIFKILETVLTYLFCIYSIQFYIYSACSQQFCILLEDTSPKGEQYHSIASVVVETELLVSFWIKSIRTLHFQGFEAGIQISSHECPISIFLALLLLFLSVAGHASSANPDCY
jgi:hypothetical protein